jgi:hypothetical protein
MGTAAQKRATKQYRERAASRGLARCEVLVRIEDRDLIRTLARRLGEDGPEAAKLRETIASAIGGADAPGSGRAILEWLRRSPLVGAGLTFEREHCEPRVVDL